MDEGTGETITAAQLEPGDVVVLPGISGPCRIQVVRSAVPGVLWLHVVDAATGARRRGHVALPLHQAVTRHTRTPAPRDAAPEDT